MKYPDGDMPAFADSDMQAGITVWQAYKMAAIQGMLANPDTNVVPVNSADINCGAEAVADAAVAGDQARNEGGNYASS